MFPLFFMGMLGANWFTKLLNGTSNNTNNMNNSYNPLRPTTVSTTLYQTHQWIEGYRQTAYKDSRGVVTVGIGITSFSNGTKPIFGKLYDANYLKSEYLIHIKSKTTLTNNLLKSYNLIQGYNQNVFDVLCDLYFQGFSIYRQGEAKKRLQISKPAFANWLLTPDGMWAQFWNPKNKKAYASRWGVLKRAYWRAHWVVGITKTPQECETWLSKYRKGEATMPSFI